MLALSGAIRGYPFTQQRMQFGYLPLNLVLAEFRSFVGLQC
jgi:hypothetical protein